VVADDGLGGEEGVGLAAAIDQVRSELVLAIEEGRDSPVRFRAGPVELEFQVAISQTKGVNGGVRVSVISFGGKWEKGGAETHRVKISLTPVDDAGNEQLIGSEGTQ
jgi:Trypsin-co-occurring domain 2